MKETLMFASITISETIQPSWLLMQSSVFLCQFSRRCINNVPCDVNEVKITISTECFRPIHSICKCFAALIVALFDRKCTAKQLKDVLQTISLLVLLPIICRPSSARCPSTTTFQLDSPAAALTREVCKLNFCFPTSVGANCFSNSFQGNRINEFISTPSLSQSVFNLKINL